MKKALAIILSGALLAGTGSAMDGGGQERAAEKAGDTRACLAYSAIVSRNAIDEQTLRFETLGGRVYHNRLSGRCPGLRQAAQGFGTLAFDLHGDQLCRGDIIRVIDSGRGAAGSLAAAPRCPLGPFERAPEAPERQR